jgi:hypothetical protein
LRRNWRVSSGHWSEGRTLVLEIRIFNPFTYRGHTELFRAIEFTFNAVNEAKKLGRNAQEFAGHSDPRTTEKHYLNEPVVVKPIR